MIAFRATFVRICPAMSICGSAKSDTGEKGPLAALSRSAPAVADLDSYAPIYILDIYIRSLRGNMKTAKIFKNGDSQAVRLPKEFRFAGNEVLIKKVGDAVVLLPKARSWRALIESLSKFPSDFMDERQQPSEAETREPMP